jgi:hypothetical protein
MSADGIVEALDVVEHVGPCLVSCPGGFRRRSLGLQRREKALLGGIVSLMIIQRALPWFITVEIIDNF